MQTPTADIVPAESSPAAAGQRILSHIRDAADSTGVSFSYLLAQATQESGLNPQARNSRSSAAGLFQFTATTWLDMIRRHGADYGLDAEAKAIVKGSDGRLTIKDKALRKAILDLRKDPALSSVMAAEFAKDNAEVLERRLGRSATASDLYLAHFLGATGAARVIEGMADNPRHSALSLLPDAARANPDMFRKANTVAGLYKTVQARFKSALDDQSDAHAPAVVARTDEAAPRPLPRPDRDAAEAAATAMAAVIADDSPTAKAVAAVAAVAATESGTGNAAAFASAIQPESPFFPAPIPPSPSLAQRYGIGPRPDSLSQQRPPPPDKGA